MRAFLALLICLLPLSAVADTWSVLPLRTRGVDEATVATFRELLVSELAARNNARFVDGPNACSDAPCAEEAGKRLGADIVVYGGLSKLGTLTIITLTVVDVPSGGPIAQQRLSVGRVEALEVAATRLAEAIITGEVAADNAVLGTVTEKEVAPPRRREGKSGLSLRLGGEMPQGTSLAAGFGMLIDVGYWYEAEDFAIEPRIRLHGSANGAEPEDGEDIESYSGVNLDVGVFYLLSRGDFAPFVGLGGGLRSIREDRIETTKIGQMVQTTTTEMKTDEQWAPGGFVRGGVMLFRTYTMRVALSVEYDMTFVDLHEHGQPKTVNAGISVFF